MAEASTSGGLFSSREQLVRLLAVTLLLPAVIVAADEAAIRLMLQGSSSTLGLLFFYGLLVTQVGLVAVAVGRLIEPSILRWATYLWCLVLIDLLLSTFVQGRGGSSGAVALAFALGSGQVGLLCFWIIFGAIHWALRLPAAALMGLFLIALVQTRTSGVWLVVLGFQLVGVIVGLLALRARGFRFLHDVDVSATGEGANSRLQFSLGHLLVWSTTAAIVFVLLQAINVRNLRYLGLADLLQAISLASCLSIVAVAAIWAALGWGRIVIRFAILLALATAASGLIYWAYVVRTEAIIVRTRGFNLNELRWEMYWIGPWWFVWTPLAGLFLAELLLFFRVRGYRLARRVRES